MSRRMVPSNKLVMELSKSQEVSNVFNLNSLLSSMSFSPPSQTNTSFCHLTRNIRIQNSWVLSVIFHFVVANSREKFWRKEQQKGLVYQNWLEIINVFKMSSLIPKTSQSICFSSSGWNLDPLSPSRIF